MSTRITATSKKTATQSIGTLWEIGFKVSPKPEQVDDQHSPVRVRVDRPDGTASVLVPNLGDDGYTVAYALDVEGDYHATVAVDGPDNSVAHLGGFTATATPADDTADTTSADEPPTDEPDPEPADAS